jgi:hypothetical protein
MMASRSGIGKATMASSRFQATRDDRGGGEGEVASFGGEGGDEPSRVIFGDRDSVEAKLTSSL